MLYCPECGGVLRYISAMKLYVCQSCGLSFNAQELLEIRQRTDWYPESEEERRERMRKEYLSWWFKSKKEK